MALKELIFNSFYFGEGVMVLKELSFKPFLCWEGVVVLKKLIFNSFYVGRVWWSEKTDLLQFLLWENGSPERTDF